VQPEWQCFVGRYAERGLDQNIEIRLTANRLMAIIDKEELLLLPEDDLHFRMQDGSEAGESIPSSWTRKALLHISSCLASDSYGNSGFC
jgi:hypothetical protein